MPRDPFAWMHSLECVCADGCLCLPNGCLCLPLNRGTSVETVTETISEFGNHSLGYVCLETILLDMWQLSVSMQGVCHRDLKPENILLMSPDRCTLCVCVWKKTFSSCQNTFSSWRPICVRCLCVCVCVCVRSSPMYYKIKLADFGLSSDTAEVSTLSYFA